MTDSRRWEFWIDVGGTFTDCFGRGPDGRLLRCKVLSSGVTKGTVDSISDDNAGVTDRGRTEPDDFWKGYQCRMLGGDGEIIDQRKIAQFDAAATTFRFDRPFPQSIRRGQPYELTAGEEAPILAIRRLLDLNLHDAFPPLVLKLATTRATNALLTRRGAKTALVTTGGFADILRIGYQDRPRLFDLSISKAEPLFAAVAEIDEYQTHDGEVLIAPSAQQVRAALLELRAQGIQALAICLLNAYAQPAHEKFVGRIAESLGFEEVRLSHEVAPLIKIVSRGDTTVVDAYLTPVLHSYIDSLRASLSGDVFGEADIRMLTSAGGLTSAESFSGKDSVLSGPAGGVVGFSRVAAAAGFDRAIGFDMGGTSTDVSRFDGRYDIEYENEKAGARIVAPMMAIETVAAGGGSICHFDGVKLSVGPDSAGADPGPACYGRGGPLTITDVNLFLGKLHADHFPFPLDQRAVQVHLRAIRESINKHTGQSITPVALAEGFLQVANANMANAIRSISIAKGYDARDYVLVGFGGAAPQHACAVAGLLGIRHVLNHPDGGILSAYGIGLADVVRHRAQGVYRAYSESAIRELGPVFEQLVASARGEVQAEGVPDDRISVTRSLDLRYRGFDAFLTIDQPDTGTYAERYESEHERLYGYVHDGRPLEIVSAKVRVVGESQTCLPRSSAASKRKPNAHSQTSIVFGGSERQANVYRRGDLQPGDTIAGPAIILEEISTTVVDPNWTAEMLSGGELLLRGAGAETATVTDASDAARPDAILLEIFNNHFAAIAEQMGITLRNTSTSVNVKERLDFSCAIFTNQGDLVVNAPHIPVHLGAMSQTVRRVLADNSTIQPNDVFVTNDPYRGGSHLPDITVVTPVHNNDGDVLFFTASRAHHAEVGGITPGSMPPFSKNLAEEGVLIRNFKLVDGGVNCERRLREILSSGAYPSRSVDDNLADISAQVAANRQGARDLLALIDLHSQATVTAYMRHIQAAAEKKMRAAIRRLPNGTMRFTDHLDDGTPIAVAITVDDDQATIDFHGTGPVLEGNLNANRAITTSAVMYCLRCLIDEDIPLNQGVLAPIEIILPECLLNPPERDSPADCAAVVGGNVETSQRLVDALLGAIGIAAASQGTMNNTLFGDESFGYYETVCGGSGATAEHDGADAVHTHMTNTRLTDPEVIARRFPVRIREFSIRENSGGAGARHGGDGVVRRIEFLRPLQLSILSQRRGPFPPYGLAGGSSGACGENVLHRADGTIEQLPSLASCHVGPRDILELRTPGGGGYGTPEA